MIAPFPDG